MIKIHSIARTGETVPYMETVKITYKTLSNEPVFVEVQGLDGSWYDGKITGSGEGYIEAREIPYMLGETMYRLRQGGDVSEGVQYTPQQVNNDGIPLPFTVQISHSKNKNPIIKASQVKGGHHVFSSMYDFLWFPRELMEPTMSAAVKCNDGVTRIYTLNWVDIDSIPWPLKDVDAGIEGSFRNYWHLQSESTSELNANTQVQYAPDYKGGMPPYYENPSVTGENDRYVFPEGEEWEDEREFTANSWEGLQQPKHKWKRVREDQSQGAANPSWSRPIPIEANNEDWVQENRFVRFFEQPRQEGECPIKIYSYFKGEQNRFAHFENYGRVFSFFDRQPGKRGWGDLTKEEQDAYSKEYGTPPGEEDAEMLLRINRLWMTLATKDIYGNLKSGWSEPMLLPEGNGDLVRYSVDGAGDINAVRQNILENNITDPDEINQLYNVAGWSVDYKDGIHNFMAYRENSVSEWQVRKVNGENGQFTKDYYKPYPISYFDRIFNPRTKGNYKPLGVSATNNPEDDIVHLNWTDAPPNTILTGYELYRASSLLSYDGSKQLGEWTLQLVSGRAPVLDWISSTHDAFYTKIEDTATPQGPKESREFEEITLSANITCGGENLFGLQEEDIKIVWKRIYNGGIEGEHIIFNNFGKRFNNETGIYDNYPEDLVEGADIPEGYSIKDSGRTLALHHTQVDSNAIFQLTIFRNVEGNGDFEGTGMAWIPYESEKIIGDYKERVVKSVVVSAETNNFVLKGNADKKNLTKDDFSGLTAINIKAFASNIDYTKGAWYVWDQAHDFNVLKEASLSSEWMEIEADTSIYWISLGDSDMNHQVKWDSDGFNKEGTDKNIYKFQVDSGTGTAVYDYVTIGRLSDGAPAIDIKLSPEVFAIPLTLDGSAYDGNTERIFKVSAQNIPSPSFKWTLFDKSRNPIAVKEGDTEFVFNAASGAVGADYRPGSLEDLKSRVPYTIEVEEMTRPDDNLLECAIINTVLGGNLALKGEPGENGISIIYDPSDIIPSEADGSIIGPVSEVSEVKVYKGGKPQKGGTNKDEYQVEITSVPEGVKAERQSYLVVRVTSVEKGAADKCKIGFKILENNINYIIDKDGNEVVFEYTLIKSKAGKHAYTVQLTNEAQVVGVDSQGVKTTVVDGFADVVAKTRLRLFSGTKEIALEPSKMSFKYNGIDLAKTLENGKTAIWGVSGATITNVSKKNYLVHKYSDNNVYVAIGEDGDVREITEVTLIEGDTGLKMERTLTLTKVEAPDGVKVIEIRPRYGTVFPLDAKLSDILVFDLVFKDNGLEVSPWGSIKVKIDNVEKHGLVSSARVLTISKSQVSSQSYITVSCGNSITGIDIINSQAAEGIVMLYCKSKVLKKGPTTSDNPYATLGSPRGNDITYGEVKNGNAGFSKASLGNTWYKSSDGTVWGVMRGSSEKYWSAPVKLVGEKGEKGKNLVQVKVYSIQVNPSLPTGDSLPPLGWALGIPTKGIIYMSERTYEYVGRNNGTEGKEKEYEIFPGTSWTKPVRLTGQGGTRQQAAYYKSLSDKIPPIPPPEIKNLEELISDPNYHVTVSDAGPSDLEYVFVTYREIDETDTFVEGKGWEPFTVFRYPKVTNGKDGKDGKEGTDGANIFIGSMPWSGSGYVKNYRLKNLSGKGTPKVGDLVIDSEGVGAIVETANSGTVSYDVRTTRPVDLKTKICTSTETWRFLSGDLWEVTLYSVSPKPTVGDYIIDAGGTISMVVGIRQDGNIPKWPLMDINKAVKLKGEDGPSGNGTHQQKDIGLTGYVYHCFNSTGIGGKSIKRFEVTGDFRTPVLTLFGSVSVPPWEEWELEASAYLYAPGSSKPYQDSSYRLGIPKLNPNGYDTFAFSRKPVRNLDVRFDRIVIEVENHASRVIHLQSLDLEIKSTR